MQTYCRLLGVVVLVAGVVVCVAATRAVLTDDAYYNAASALERHTDHILFQAEYQAALARHTAYIVAAVVAGAGGLVTASTLFALAAVLGRLDGARARAAS